MTEEDLIRGAEWVETFNRWRTFSRQWRAIAIEAMDVFTRFEALANRFSGADLKCRDGWWVARLIIAKNERAAYRTGWYGRTPKEAIAGLVAVVADLDRK